MPSRFAIIGDPVAHSLSPVLHGTAFAALGIDATYVPLRVPAHDLTAVWERRLRDQFDGFNVTLPHKSTVIPLLDAIDPFAATIGAVNTVTKRDGALTGTNTDVLGIRRSLEPYRTTVQGRGVVVIGGGGTARSATAAITDLLPSSITFLARDTQRCEALLAMARTMHECPAHAVRLDDPSVPSVVAGATLIIQTTPVGMEPQIDRSPLPPGLVFSSAQTVFDVIYRPLETRLLAAARRSGARTIDGLDLFLHQGAAAFEMWTGRAMPLQDVKPAVLRSLNL